MHFTKYFLLLLYIRTFSYCFCSPQSTSLSLPWCVQGIATPKEKHRGKKGSRDQKTVFASFEFCFFVVRRQWTGLAGPIWQRCIRSLCAGGPGQAAWAEGSEVNGLQEERSVCGGIINNILSAFCVKFADFFSLSLWPCLLFFACCFCSPTLNAGLQQFWGLVSTTPDRVLLIFEAHFWAQYGSYIRAKSCG